MGNDVAMTTLRGDVARRRRRWKLNKRPLNKVIDAIIYKKKDSKLCVITKTDSKNQFNIFLIIEDH